MTHNFRLGYTLLFLLMAFTVPQIAISQNSDDAREVTSTYYIKHAFVVQKPGTILDSTSILIKDGLIKAIGPNIPIPFDAKVIDADSMYVYPAFIDACSHIGISKSEDKERSKVSDPGNPPKNLAGITPQQSVRNAIGDKLDKSMNELQEQGFGYVHVVPMGLMLPGQGSVLSTGEGERDRTILKENISQFAQFNSARGMFPATTIGVMSQFRDLYKNAENTSKYSKIYQLNPAGLERPNASEELEALYPVVNKTMPVFLHAPMVKDVNRALILNEELGFNLVLTGVRQGWPLIGEIQKGKHPVVLSLNLPEKSKDASKDKSKKEKGKKKGKKDKMAKAEETTDEVAKAEETEDEEVKEDESVTVETTEKIDSTKKKENPELARLNARKKKSEEEYVGQAAFFEKNGVQFSFSSLDTKLKDIKGNLIRMIAGGLSENAALSALTTNPASLLGISNMAGSIEVGKIANLFISDKPYFDEKSKIKYVLSDGVLKEFKEEKKSKKSEGGDSKSMAGTWSYSVEVPGQTISGTMILTGSGDKLEVKIDSSDEPGDFDDGTDVSVDGSNLTFKINVNGMVYSIDVELNDGNLEGTVNVGEFGTFPMTGSKQDDPE